jgi:RNA polymerase sigma factor (sigma-70 family)
MMALVDAGEQFRLHVDELVRFATLLVGPDDATDVVSEAVTATLSRGSLAGVENVRAYWFRAVLNTAADAHRRSFSRRRREERLAAMRVTVHDSMPADDARGLLTGLSPQQKAVVFLTYWHDLPPARVAELLDVSEGTVRKQLARAREQLREVLRDD